ncbi:MAG: hypothetical protein AB7N65_08380 [Vicinamibacterales bacterium]
MRKRVWFAIAAVGLTGCSAERAPSMEAARLAASAAAGPVTIVACVVPQHDGGYRLRLATGTGGSQGLDASGGGEVSAGRTVVPEATERAWHDGSSTAANAPWIGTRDYIPQMHTQDASDLASYAGQFVSVTGTVEVPDPVRPAGTDQLQSQRGATFKQFAVTSLTPLYRECPLPSRSHAAPASAQVTATQPARPDRSTPAAH